MNKFKIFSTFGVPGSKEFLSKLYFGEFSSDEAEALASELAEQDLSVRDFVGILVNEQLKNENLLN